MGRKKNLSTARRNEALSKIDPALSYFRKANSGRKEKFLTDYFSAIFSGKISESRFNYGLSQVKFLFAPTSKFKQSSNLMILKAFEDEYKYLLKRKNSIPTYFLSLLAMDLINEIIKRYGVSPKDEKIVEVVKKIHDLSEISGENFEEASLKKEIPVSLIEHILIRSEYDLALKAYIYKSENRRLKHDFGTYCLLAINEYPYYYLNRGHQADTLFQWLFLLTHFKLHKPINKKSPYPPKRVEILECMQATRNNKDSTGKIHSEIQALLDPDHSSNHITSTEIG